MQSFLKNLFLSPRLWLSAGVLCLGVSILLGYHGDQMEAENALAQKIAVPARVVVQEFSGETDENELGEVHFLSEIAIEHVTRIDVGNENATRLVDIVPIYPVSRQSMPIATSLSDKKRRPAPRSEASAIASREAQLTQIENISVGLLVFDVGGKAPLEFLESVSLAPGQNGALVDVSGVRLSDPAILQNATAPLLLAGVNLIDDALVISPYVQGRPSQNGSDYSGLKNALFWASMLMIAFGLASLFSLLPSFKKAKSGEASSEIKAVGTLPAVDPFQPIAKQEELSEEPEVNKTRRTSRVMTVASNVFRTKSRP